MSHLYEIVGTYKGAFEKLSNMEGMSADDIRDSLADIEDDIKTKSLAVAGFILNMEAEATAIKGAEANMAKRRKALETKAAGMRAYLMLNLKAVELKEVKSAQYVIRIKQNPQKVEIYDEQAIRDMGDLYLRIIPQTTEIDVAGISTALKAGEVVDGARLVRGEKLDIN